MNNKLWSSSIAALIVGLSTVCHADSAAVPTVAADFPGTYTAAALYNLGNSYAHQGKPALAVLAYERAQILAPRDPDIRANLRKVRDSVELPQDPSGFSDRFRWGSPNTTYWIGVVGLLLAGAGWMQLSFLKSHRVASRLTMATGLLLVAFTVGDAIATEPTMHRSVVLQTASASASPTLGTGSIFTLPEASVVQRQDEHGGFTLVRDLQGRIGWIPQEVLMPIISSPGDTNAKP